MAVESLEMLEDEEGTEIIEWPVPKYQRVCVNGHLVTDLFNSYEVPNGSGVRYACKRCQLEANQRLKEKKEAQDEQDPDLSDGLLRVIPPAFKEHEPGPDEHPGDVHSPVMVALQRIESKLDNLVEDRHPHIATRLLTDRIKQLEAQIEELKKGPSLEEMTFDQLKAKASSLGIEVPKGLRSAGVRKLIQEHQAGESQEPEPKPEPEPEVELDEEGIAEAIVVEPKPEPEVEESPEDDPEPEPEEDPEPEAADETEDVDLDEMVFEELKALALKMGLDVSGKRSAGLRKLIREEMEERNQEGAVAHEPEQTIREHLEEDEDPKPRRRGVPPTDEELERAAEEAAERQRRKRAQRQAEEGDEEEPEFRPRARRRRRLDDEEE